MRKWMLRATNNSDEVRNPVEKRRAVRSTARRLARGPPSVETSADQWPGEKTSNRPVIAFPGGTCGEPVEPHAEPVEPQEKLASLDSDLSVHARKVQSTVSAWSPRSPPWMSSKGREVICRRTRCVLRV